MRNILQQAFQVALKAALPQHCLPPRLPSEAELPDPALKGRIVVIGAGKASAAMAEAFEQHAKANWPRHYPLISGLVLTRYGHARPCERIEIVEAAHPVPDQAGFDAATRMLNQTVRGLTANDLVVALISGGGSSLLALPAKGITLAEKQAMNKALLSSGASISEMNTVRKHLSAIKGGRLALACAPAKLHTFLISDVPGDDPAVIASGPTLADASTCAEALAIIKKYGIEVNPAIEQQLIAGHLETVKADHPYLRQQKLSMIATPKMALDAAAAWAKQQGIACYVLADDMEGEARDVALVHASIARYVHRFNQPFAKPCLLLSGGEATVSLPKIHISDGGNGGRNVEFLLHLVNALQGMPKVAALAADTDGVDGSLDIAGAFIDESTLSRASAKGLSIKEAIRRHDGHGFFQALGDSLITGPTYTNVNDFRAVLIF